MNILKPIACVVETGIYAEDLDKSEQFYREVLGLTLLRKEIGRHVFFEVGEYSMLLVFRSEATLRGDHLPSHGSRGSGHFALGIASEDLALWRERLEAYKV